MHRISKGVMKVVGVCVRVAIVASVLGVSHVGAQQGNCDPGGGQRKVLEVNGEKTIDAAATITVTEACSDVTQVIRKCAVLAHKKIKAQKWCYPEGKPAYFEYFDILEYSSD